MLSISFSAPAVFAIPPPKEFALLLATVLPVIVALASLRMPAPAPAVLSVMVLSTTVRLFVLSMPPPTPPALLFVMVLSISVRAPSLRIPLPFAVAYSSQLVRCHQQEMFIG
jgi:hypothetical protein